MGRHSEQSRSSVPLIAGLVAIVLVAGGLVIARVVDASSDSGAGTAGGTVAISGSSSTAPPSSAPSSAATPAVTTSAPSSPTTSAAQAAVRAALSACVARQAAVAPLMSAVTTGAKHWSDHVQAETDLESGARSLIDVKTNTWGPTRAAGPGDVAAYDAASAAWGQTPACATAASDASVPSDLTTKLQACTTREQSLDAWVGAGAAVMQDWRTHLGEMADHADGHTNSALAQANWLKRWREAPTHLTPYAAATTALAAAPACAA